MMTEEPDERPARCPAGDPCYRYTYSSDSEEEREKAQSAAEACVAAVKARIHGDWNGRCVYQEKRP
jgi:hypothetical protein